jgi:hypothetical protein
VWWRVRRRDKSSASLGPTLAAIETGNTTILVVLWEKSQGLNLPAAGRAGQAM